MDDLVEYHARRNLYVHNGGVVNSRYLEAVRDIQTAVGDRLEITSEYWTEGPAHVNQRRHTCPRSLGPKVWSQSPPLRHLT